jgi:hypothetical protein
MGLYRRGWLYYMTAKSNTKLLEPEGGAHQGKGMGQARCAMQRRWHLKKRVKLYSYREQVGQRRGSILDVVDGERGELSQGNLPIYRKGQNEIDRLSSNEASRGSRMSWLGRTRNGARDIVQSAERRERKRSVTVFRLCRGEDSVSAERGRRLRDKIPRAQTGNNRGTQGEDREGKEAYGLPGQSSARGWCRRHWGCSFRAQRAYPPYSEKNEDFIEIFRTNGMQYVGNHDPT